MGSKKMSKQPDNKAIAAQKAMLERIADCCPDAMTMDGFDDCVIGICRRFGHPTVIAYDYEKVIQQNMASGMDREDAEEFFEFNQIGSFVGEGTPCFIETDP